MKPAPGPAGPHPRNAADSAEGRGGPARPAARREPERPPLLTQRLLALFVAGALLLNFPLLVPALGGGAAPGGAAEATILGLPRLPLLLFATFALLVALLAVLMERGGED
jgi:hypothetical protein